MEPLTAALITGGAALVGAAPQLIPTKYEREQKKRLKELERKQEMGLLGLTDRQEQQMQTMFANTRDQAQRRQDAEMRRLSTPTAQPGQQMLGAQMSMDNRQRLEADIASQILGMDLKRKAEQEADIEALKAGQAQIRKDRVNAAIQPFTSAGEAYIKAQTLERLIGQMPEEDKDMFMREEMAKKMAPVSQTQQILNSFGPDPVQGMMFKLGIDEKTANQLVLGLTGSTINTSSAFNPLLGM